MKERVAEMNDVVWKKYYNGFGPASSVTNAILIDSGEGSDITLTTLRRIYW
jgi:hypothetical protein